MEYQNYKDKGITQKYKDIKFTKIVADDFDVEMDNVEHRPVRDPHINKMFHGYSGVYNPITVAFNKEDNKYHIVDGQHRWFNLKKQISMGIKKQPYRLHCIVLYWEDTMNKLDLSRTKDKKIANEVSFCANEGNERTCVIERIYQVWKMAQKYVILQGGMKGKKLPYGVVEHIITNWKGYEKLSDNTVKQYISYGQRLHENNLFNNALYERWTIPRIIEELDIMSGKIKVKTYPITIQVSKKELMINEDVKKLRFNYIYWDKILTEKILDRG